MNRKSIIGIMMSRKSGYFICYRNIWQHPVFKNLLQASCWIYMISSASHQDKDLRFLDNKIFVRRGEMIMPLRVTAKRFKMSYSEMRTFSNKNVNKSSKEYEEIGTEGNYIMLRKKSDGKKYLKHKWKDEPLKDY